MNNAAQELHLGATSTRVAPITVNSGLLMSEAASVIASVTRSGTGR